MANNKRLQVAKLLDRLGNAELEEEEEEEEEEDEDGFEQFQPRFACPYCYEQFEVTSLCVHLVDEHMFDSKSVLCPICANDVDDKELVNHITVQHESLFGFNKIKMPKTEKLSLATRDTNNNPMSQARKELQQTYLRALLQSGTNNNNNYNNNNNNNSLNNEATASLFSSLLSDFDNNSSGGQSAKKPTVPVIPLVEDLVRKPVLRSFKSRINISLSKEEKELRHKRSLVRASFTQDLILSTLFGE
ncbi:hypothetical protein LUZ60_012659 [Juncus effusus]|nr:hypothetical protein LUZ60_012659 [Juncus effusus]